MGVRDQLDEASRALQIGDTRRAYRMVADVVGWPRVPVDDVLGAGLAVLGGVADGLQLAGLAEALRAYLDQGANVSTTFDLGYHLIDVGMHPVAVTILERAHAAWPDVSPVLHELAAALEGVLAHGRAREHLHRAVSAGQTDFWTRYLLGFHAVMSGDLDTARGQLPELDREASEPAHRSVVDRLAGMLLRAEAVSRVSSLDEADLRGWHAAINGSVLLHLAPEGGEVMRGRFALVYDSYEQCHEAVLRLAAVLRAVGYLPPRVFLLPDRDSTALGLAAATHLGLPAERWPVEGDSRPGLIAVCNPAGLTSEQLDTLAEHRPGQVLWCHATPWTRDQPVVGDLVGLLSQVYAPPWGARVRLDPETGRAEPVSPDPSDPETLARRVLAAEVRPESLADLDELVALAQALVSLPGTAGAGLQRRSGRRRRQWAGSPVQSSRLR